MPMNMNRHALDKPILFHKLKMLKDPLGCGFVHTRHEVLPRSLIDSFLDPEKKVADQLQVSYQVSLLRTRTILA